MHPILNRLLPHTGVDLAASTGEPVRATADGIVAAAGTNGGYGLLIELKHPDGLGTRYAHLSRIEPGIRPRTIVRQGQVIGYVGMTGLATGPHLHFEIRRRGQAVDPMAWLGSAQLGGPVGAANDWAKERGVIADLLARTPTVVNSRDASS
jgi:murein DD-endopeptidase MepM/ murein hydrolase activator NlpD